MASHQGNGLFASVICYMPIVHPACRHVRTLNLPANAAAQLLTLAHQQGKLVAHSWQDLALHLFTCNGRHVTTAEGNEKLNALVVSNDGRFLLTGGTKGCITLRWLHSLQVWCCCHSLNLDSLPSTPVAQ